MKELVLVLALALTVVQGEQDSYHPLVSYGLLKNVPSRDDSAQELSLVLDEDDGIEAIGSNRCNNERFRRCIDQYANDLDLDKIPKDSLAFVRQLKDIVEDEGVEGLKRECRAGTNLKRCLGDQYEKCFSEDYLRSRGVSETDAKVFVTLSVQMTYQCSTGLDTLIRNWDCIERVQREKRQQFARCHSDYVKNIQDDPQNICKYTQEMVNCMTSPFKQSCSPAVYGVICHSLQISITTTLPQCSIVCTKGSKDLKMSDGRVDTLSTFLSRVLLENIPAQQFMAFRRRSWPPTSTTCDDPRFKRCMIQFAKDVGLPEFPKRARALASYLNQLIATRRAEGFERVCTAARNVGTCLGDQLESCFTTQHLEALGVSASDVLIYRELQAALASECGSGYEVIHKNIDCMIDCAERHQAEFVRCAAEFERSVQREPSKVCDYAQTFLRCNTGLLEQSCGSELSAATCNAMRAEISVPLPTCKNLTCASEEDFSLIDPNGLLTGGPAVFTMDTLADSQPATALRQAPTLDEDDSSSDSDDDNDDDDEAVVDAQAKCNDRKFGQCLKGYAQQLGLKSFPQDPAEFGKALNALLAKYGKIGFKKICTSGAKLVKCLGRQQIRACINLKHLQELGLTKEQATGYILVGKLLGYECTKGYRVLFNNFDCIVNVTKRYNATLQKCAQDFIKKAKQDPKNICKYAQTLVNCDIKPYSDKCNRQVAPVLCQIIQISFKTVLPKCQIKCRRSDIDTSDELPPSFITRPRPIPADDDGEADAADMLAS